MLSLGLPYVAFIVQGANECMIVGRQISHFALQYANCFAKCNMDVRRNSVLAYCAECLGMGGETGRGQTVMAVSAGLSRPVGQDFESGAKCGLYPYCPLRLGKSIGRIQGCNPPSASATNQKQKAEPVHGSALTDFLPFSAIRE